MSYNIIGSDNMEDFIPDMYKKNIFKIDYDKLQKQGIKCLLIDLDNTLIKPKENPDKKTKELIRKLKNKGFNIIIFSNASPRHVKKSQKYFILDAVSLCFKPLRGKFDYIMTKHKYTLDEVAIIGDRLLTDIYGGNKVGITTILTDPLTTDENIFQKLSRKIENKKINQLEKQKLFKKGKYYD